MSLQNIFVTKTLILAMCCAVLVGCASTPKAEKAAVLKLNSGNFADFALDPDAAVLVLFSNGADPSGAVAGQYYQYLSTEFAPLVFATFSNADKTILDAYGVTETPTVALFSNGFLIDKIAGKPASYVELQDFQSDFKLWMQTTVAAHTLKRQSKVNYRFNNSTKMTIANH